MALCNTAHIANVSGKVVTTKSLLEGEIPTECSLFSQCDLTWKSV